MIKFAKFAAAAALATVATAAYADETGSFRLDGRTYNYTSTTAADGSTVLRGTSNPGGDFDFVVRDGVVKGYVSGQPISFRTSEARGAARRAAVTVAKAPTSNAVGNAD